MLQYLPLQARREYKSLPLCLLILIPQASPHSQRSLPTQLSFVMSNGADMDNLTQRLAAGISLTDAPPSHCLDIGTTAGKFLCDICHQALSTRWNLRQHVVERHMTVRNYACTECRKVYKCHFDLKKHIERAHSIVGTPASEVKVFPCPYPGCSSCKSKIPNESFYKCKLSICPQPSLGPITVHEKGVHYRMRDHVCPFAGCPKANHGFSQRYDLDIHLQKHHASEVAKTEPEAA
ncbi:hypothetical protein LXA43DRAFT_138721 [Ganoderma leucocontextum]|nr:hypothetical protein LXA43DRAFT_138721 [Ganoderma leucocontextum]